MDIRSAGVWVTAAELRVAATGPRPPEEVWDRYTRPAAWPTWAPHLREVDHPHETVRPGTTGRVTGVGGLVAVFHVDAVDEEARRWTWRARSGPVRLAFEHGVDAATPESGHPGGSTAWILARGPGPLVLGYAPLARWALGRLVADD
ncbi:SRPBCC family protein [Oryzobacter terrae]|uniref:SRPBCC family protein n=1 Tax=Oryzobacter terrae TaxID=1620385 RepID=UPI00366CEB30